MYSSRTCVLHCQANTYFSDYNVFSEVLFSDIVKQVPIIRIIVYFSRICFKHCETVIIIRIGVNLSSIRFFHC